MKCPYCNGDSFLSMSSAFIYNGKDYGPVHACENFPTCDSYVGCHRENNEPLGRMANKELRFWKKKAHEYFDTIWKDGIINKINPQFIKGINNRKKAYTWLSKEMGTSIDLTHIGMFDVDMCKKVVEICKKYINE